MRIRGTTAFVLPLLCAAVDAKPTVFVTRDRSGASWWLLKADLRPTDNRIEGVTIDAINRFRAARRISSAKLCKIEAVDRNSFAGTDRLTQGEIQQTFLEVRHNPFRQTFTTRDGRSFTARVGIESECASGRKGAIVLIYETGTKRVADVTVWNDRPFTFIAPEERPRLLLESGCFECSAFSLLYYDVRRKRFRWEYAGD